MRNEAELLAAAEAILFAAGEPLETDRLAEALGLEPEQARVPERAMSRPPW